MDKGARRNRAGKNLISVANLPEEFTIDDPKEYIKVMRTNYLKTARKDQGLTIKEVSQEIGIGEQDVVRIESGNVNQQDMMALSKLCDLYNIDYPSILFMFKLARRPEREMVEKLAAYHDQKVDEETQKELVDFLSKLKGSIE